MVNNIIQMSKFAANVQSEQVFCSRVSSYHLTSFEVNRSSQYGCQWYQFCDSIYSMKVRIGYAMKTISRKSCGPSLLWDLGYTILCQSLIGLITAKFHVTKGSDCYILNMYNMARLYLKSLESQLYARCLLYVKLEKSVSYKEISINLALKFDSFCIKSMAK